MKKEINKSPSEILRESTGVDEIYQGIIIGAISVIPHIGGIMNEILFQEPSKFQQKRLINTVQILEKKLNKIENDLIDANYLQTEDFYDFNNCFWKSSIKIRDEKIRENLADIFINSILLQDSYEFGVNRLFMNFSVDLTPIQIIILSFINSSESILHKIETYDNFFNRYNGYDKKIIIEKSEFKYYCTDLENKGLITSNGGLRDFDVKDYILYDEQYEEPSVLITNLGKKFISFLKNN